MNRVANVKRHPEEENRFAGRLMEHLAVAAFVLDPTGRVTIWNRACERLTGLLAGEVLGTRAHWRAFYDHERPCLADLLLTSRSEDAAALYEISSNTEANPYGISAENWCNMPHLGRQLYLGIDVAKIHDETGRLVAVVETLRDMTAQKLTELQLAELAGKDALTSLFNRRGFDLKLADVCALCAVGKPMALLLVDLDNFKLCNDALGHLMGDVCLREVANVIAAQAAAAEGFAARLGGDEFAIVLPDADWAKAQRVAEAVRAAVQAAKLPPFSETVRITASVGGAVSVKPRSVQELLAAADASLYVVKRSGRNGAGPIRGEAVTKAA